VPHSIEALVMPTQVDAPDASDFLAMVGIRNRIEIDAYQSQDRYLAPADILPFYQDEHAPVRMFGVRQHGELAAFSLLETQATDAEHLWMTINVQPESRRHGIGTALLQHAEAVAADEGRRKLLIYASSAEAPGERLPAPTGFGSLPADNPEVRFLLGHGYRLEQIERGSRLALPVAIDPPEAPEDYRLHYWERHTPERWLADVATLYTRISTDAPSAGLDEPEDVYTVERVLEFEATHADSPRTRALVAVEHIPTGRLAGFSEARVPQDASRAISQGTTLVLREHRGRRLGMLLKSANLARLQRDFPGHPSVVTFNAEENRFMLDVNEALGFVTTGYEGGWRKDI
jgi:GNAT superfamily N-acetyltransferase